MIEDMKRLVREYLAEQLAQVEATGLGLDERAEEHEETAARLYSELSYPMGSEFADMLIEEVGQ